MIEFHPQVRAVHVDAVLVSGALFALRGAAVLAGARWPLVPPVRYASYAIDTVLLTAALMLLTMLPGAVFANHWLSVKLVLVVAYIVLGSLALRRARHARVRAICFTAALVVYGVIFGMARAHHPLGWLARLDAPSLIRIGCAGPATA